MLTIFLLNGENKTPRMEKRKEIYSYGAQGQLKVGVGTVSITPDWPVILSYGRQEPTDSAFDTAKVKVLLLAVDNVEIALIMCDVIGIRKKDAAYIKEQIADHTSLSPNNMIVAATHNHSYPRVYKKKIRNFIAEQSIKAAELAFKNQFEARIGIGKFNIREDLNMNRAELNGLANSLLYIILIEDSKGRLKGFIYNYGTHPTLFTEWGSTQGQIGPNWPGLVNRYVRSKLNFDLYHQRYEYKKDIPTYPFLLFTEGAAGDQQARRSGWQINRRPATRRQVFVEKLSKEILELIPAIETKREISLQFRSRSITLPTRNKYKKQTLLQAIIMDQTVIATIPGELNVKLGLEYERESPFKNNILITNADDYIGYIVSEEFALEKVTYQAKGKRFDPHYGVYLIDQALKLVNRNHVSTPPLNPDNVFGKISGKVYYEGDNIIAIGAKRIPSKPNYGGGFWGKRTVINNDGTWGIDSLAPGTFYLYAAEANPANPKPKRLKSGYSDIRVLSYGRPVKVRAGQTAKHIDYHFPKDYGQTKLKSIDIIDTSLIVDGYQLSGKIKIKGNLSEDEKINIGVYPAHVPYRKEEVFLTNPVVFTQANRTGRFIFSSLPPGHYRLAAICDINHNARPEFKVDVVSRLKENPAIRIFPREKNQPIIYK
jgi:hypothetical protein